MAEEYIVEVLANDDCITKGELIRCRECRWYTAKPEYHWGTCENYRTYAFDENDYCARAERDTGSDNRNA